MSRFGDSHDEAGAFYHSQMNEEEAYKHHKKELLTQKLNKMQKSKVATIIGCKPWNGNNGTVYYHDIIMDNGDKINIGKKKELAIGEELEYEITETK